MSRFLYFAWFHHNRISYQHPRATWCWCLCGVGVSQGLSAVSLAILWSYSVNRRIAFRCTDAQNVLLRRCDELRHRIFPIWTNEGWDYATFPSDVDWGKMSTKAPSTFIASQTLIIWTGSCDLLTFGIQIMHETSLTLVGETHWLETGESRLSWGSPAMAQEEVVPNIRPG